MKLFPMATLNLAWVIPGEDLVRCFLETGCNAAPKQETHVDAQPSTMFMSAGLD